jgi:hypothetical protein
MLYKCCGKFISQKAVKSLKYEVYFSKTRAMPDRFVCLLLGLFSLFSTFWHSIQATENQVLEFNILAPTRGDDSNPLHWIEASDDEIYNAIDIIHDNPSYLPYTDPLSLRVQAIADRLDSKLRLYYPARMAVVPKPRIRLMKKSQANAFVSKSLVCVSINARLGDTVLSDETQDTRLSKDELILQFSANGRIGVFTKDQIECIDRRQLNVNTDDVIDWLQNSLLLESCDVTSDENTLYLGKNCDLGQYHGVHTQTLALMTASNRITLMTGLFDLSQDIEDLIFPIYHELAHYYRSHGSLIKKSFQYFYSLSSTSHSRAKPLADHSLDDLGERLLALPKFRTQTVTGQKYHSELFSYNKYAMHTLIKPACRQESSSCFIPCQNLDQFISDETMIQRTFKSFPQAQLNEDGLRQYFVWENYLKSCYSSISVQHKGPSKPGDIAYELSRKVYWNSDEKKAQAAETLLDLFLLMNESLEKRDFKHNVLLQKAIDHRLGIYTTEQEADHLAVDWMLMQGLSGEKVMTYWLNYIRSKSGSMQDSKYSLNARRCLKLYYSSPRWSEDGRFVPIPLGSFSQTHLSPCFRLWNLEQRIRTKLDISGFFTNSM